MLNTQVQAVLSFMDSLVDVNIEFRFFICIVALVWCRFILDNAGLSLFSHCRWHN